MWIYLKTFVAKSLIEHELSVHKILPISLALMQIGWFWSPYYCFLLLLIHSWIIHINFYWSWYLDFARGTCYTLGKFCSRAGVVLEDGTKHAFKLSLFHCCRHFTTIDGSRRPNKSLVTDTDFLIQNYKYHNFTHTLFSWKSWVSKCASVIFALTKSASMAFPSRSPVGMKVKRSIYFPRQTNSI